MSCSIMEWPRSYQSAVLTVTYDFTSEPDPDGLSYTDHFAITETWTRRPLAGLNKCLPLVAQLLPGEFVATINPCFPTFPSILPSLPAWLDLDPEERPIIGTRTFTVVEGETPEPEDIRGGGISFEIEPAWSSKLRHKFVTHSDPQTAEVAIAAIEGEGVIEQREQVITATYAGARAMNGTAQVAWTDGGAPHQTYHWQVSWDAPTGAGALGTAPVLFGPVATATPVAPFPTWDAWAYLTAYAVFDVVAFDSLNYECLAAHQLTLDDIEALNSPDLRPDLWRVFDIRHHILTTAVRDGVRFAFMGRFAEQGLFSLLVLGAHEVVASVVTAGKHRVSFGWGEGTTTAPSGGGADTDLQLPGDGDFQTTLEEGTGYSLAVVFRLE